MQKFFLKSCLVVAPLLLSSQSYAQSDNYMASPIVTVGGFVHSNAGFRSEDGDFKNERLPDAAMTGTPKAVDNDTGSHNRMTNNPDFTNEGEIHIKVAGINELGMKYGAIVELEANVSTAARNEGVNADKAFVFTESRIGKLELGNNSAANHRMKVGPETFARGAGGINGKYLEYINMPMLANSSQLPAGATAVCTGGIKADDQGALQGSNACDKVKLPRFILIPQAPIAHGGYAKGFYNRATDNDYKTSANVTNSDDDYGFNKNKTSSQVRDGSFGDLEDASKISYYTPRIAGWQLGASFTPDTGTNGTSATISGDNSGDIKQAIAYGVNYSDSFGNLGVAVSATGENGKFEQISSSTTKRENLKAYDIGVMLTYAGATIGGSYGNWGSSLQPKTGIYSCDYNDKKAFTDQDCAGANAGQKFSDSIYYTAGAAYQFGPFAASITYLNSNFQENQYSAGSFGIDYKMAKGLMPYLEVTKFKFESNQPKSSDLVDQSQIANSDRQLKDNQGYVVLAGLLFSF
ncbi:MAG: outer membrane protein (porin) [Rickettsiaceae bacterium]|jgi:hypothetical protein|nr:outer membrane protein (porin) [Rickettsiaceae bacterium]